jgi:O-antigen/teichoic acid export membrane protein/uncharacterized heparinase superfamily protein
MVVRGGVYLTARYALSMVVSLGNVFVLTWWIGPHAYGTYVTAVGLTSFLASLTRFGVDTYLVRCEAAPDVKQYNVAFTLVLAASSGLALLGAALTPLLERWYSDGEFVAPYLVLLLSIPLTGLAGVPTARLERELRFGVVAGIELGGQFSAFLASLLLAWQGFGVWAPVAGLFVWQAVVLAAAWRAAHFSPRLQFDAAYVRSMLAFGMGFSASLRTWQLRTLVNPLLVGRFAGPECVAYVAFAVRIVESLGFIRIAAGRLAIAALARLQHDGEQFRAALERALRIQVVTIGPLLGAFAVAGPWLVPRFMGARWLPSLEVYPLVAASVLINSVFNLQASALFVLGRQWTVMWSYVAHVAVLTVSALLLVPRMGIPGYGWAELIACAAYGVIGYVLSQLVTISYGKLVPWAAAFGLPLFFAAGDARGFWLPLVGVAVALGCRRLPARANSNPRGSSAGGPVSVRVVHLLTLLSKTNARGWPYLSGLLEYKSRSALYSIRKKIARAPSILQRHAAEAETAGENAFYGGFHFTPCDIPRIVASIPEKLKQAAVAEADRAMQHCFRFRGQERAFGGAIDWSARGNSTSWAWDLNRHAWFLRLATAFYYTGNAVYLHELTTVWEDWIHKNPPGSGFNWQHPFEVAARLGNWTWAYVLLAYSRVHDSQCLQRLKSSLEAHADYLQSHLEHHWPNNHLLLEVKSFCEFALLFPELDRGFSKRARAILEREVMEQVLADGAHAELCSMYHRVIAGELGELARLSERCGQPLAERAARRIEEMEKFTRALLRRDGSCALLGDSAESDTCIRFDFARRECSDLNYWVGCHAGLDTDGVSPLCISDVPRLHGGVEIRSFPEAGYAFLTSRTSDDEVHVTFDFGSFSRCRSPNHGHCDALGFELYARGHPLIVDPGVYLPWNTRIPWARHFRGTAAHNTLMIDGREQSDLSAYCDVGKTARVRRLRQESSDERATIAGECIPYWAESEGIAHRREISLQTERLTIHDQIVGSGDHLLTWSFQFAPDLDIACDDGRIMGRLPEQGKDTFSLSATAAVSPRLELYRGQTNLLRGWVSRNSAEVLPAYVAQYSIRTKLPYEVQFVVDLSGQPAHHG